MDCPSYPWLRRLIVNAPLVFYRFFAAAGFVIVLADSPAVLGVQTSSGVDQFRKEIKPILTSYCYDCHGEGMKKGGLALDGYNSDEALVQDRELWFTILKYLRAGIMPPARKEQPKPEEKALLTQWIKAKAFGIDPKNPDPGRVTIRRLNRVEYRNTIRDLMGVDFRSEVEFPPDDTGYGFDDIGDVLTLPPMLMEKYIKAAKAVVKEAVPLGAKDTNSLSKPRNYDRFFTQTVPPGKRQQRAYARELLGRFADSAFRRPVDDHTLGRLVSLAEQTYTRPGKTFEAGIAQAMVAVLASPRFLFRIEERVGPAGSNGYALLDEYSLASRLSYFLWSTMPDEPLFNLAKQGQLRTHLVAEVKRMVADPRADAMVNNFTGQWLQARDVEGTSINERVILARDRFEPKSTEHSSEAKQNASKKRTVPPELELDQELRHAMQRETQMYFAGIVREDRDVAELLDSDYTYLNQKLARLYGLTNISGSEMRKVLLPEDSHRGGVLTQGTVLLVTSNPDRTSPVKRGLFILDNLLGTPPPPPPPNVPLLEASEKEFKDHQPTLRESLEMHRDKPLCSSCHARMDPIGLAFENFNAMGMWREYERGQPIEAGGRLVTGESFADVQELKKILVQHHRQEFFRCLTEKLLTYALGRGLECYDVETVDQIVQRLENQNGRFSALLLGIVESAPFQKQRVQALANVESTGAISGKTKIAKAQVQP